VGARAGFLDGNQLFDRCSQPNGSVGESFCLAYITAITDALVDEGSRNGVFRACFPDGVRAGQVEDVGKPASRGGVIPVRLELVAGVRYFGRYRSGAIRDGVLLSVG
jgi:hypothetical protein